MEPIMIQIFWKLVAKQTNYFLVQVCKGQKKNPQKNFSILLSGTKIMMLSMKIVSKLTVIMVMMLMMMMMRMRTTITMTMTMLMMVVMMVVMIVVMTMVVMIKHSTRRLLSCALQYERHGPGHVHSVWQNTVFFDVRTRGGRRRGQTEGFAP